MNSIKYEAIFNLLNFTVLFTVPILLGTASINQKIVPEEPLTITIWIHGSIRSRDSFHDTIHNKTPLQSLYFFKRIIKSYLFVPRAQFFYVPIGLHPLENIDPSTHHRTLGEILQKQYLHSHIYLFGWSGKRSFNVRKKAAHELRTALDILLQKYQHEYGYTPKLRLITHSHGGNVALNLACIKNNYPNDLFIDELILLACPVQDATEPFSTDPMFKHIYSLYSTTDLYQIIDPQGAYSSQKNIAKTFFSRRTFTPHKNLTQVSITINNRCPMHIEFILSQFVCKLSNLIAKINTSDQTRKKSALNISTDLTFYRSLINSIKLI